MSQKSSLREMAGNLSKEIKSDLDMLVDEFKEMKISEMKKKDSLRNRVRFEAAEEIILDVFTQLKEIQRAAEKTGKFQHEPGEVYLSGDCLRLISRHSQYKNNTIEGFDTIFGLPIYKVSAAGYHVRVAPRLDMRLDTQL